MHLVLTTHPLDAALLFTVHDFVFVVPDLFKVSRVHGPDISRPTHRTALVLRLILLRIQNGKVERPEDAAGRLEGDTVRKGHVSKVDELQSKLVTCMHVQKVEFLDTWASGQTCQLAWRAGKYMSLYLPLMCSGSRPSM
jgi:hypothetical protein